MEAIEMKAALKVLEHLDQAIKEIDKTVVTIGMEDFDIRGLRLRKEDLCKEWNRLSNALGVINSYETERQPVSRIAREGQGN